MNQIKPGNYQRKRVKKLVAISILTAIIVCGLTYAILRAVTGFFNTSTLEFDKPVTFNWPVRVVKREPVIVEKVTREIVHADDTDYAFVRVSHYWPPLGGTNCANFVNGECLSKMANGERWQEWVGLAVACPPEFKFGTKLKIGDRVWECKDRGSKIQTDGDLFWVDMLTYEGLYDYGEIVKAEILK